MLFAPNDKEDEEMKIVHILKGKANPNKLNGVNKVVHHLATEQLRSGTDVEVWGITATPNKIRHQHHYPLRLFPTTGNRFCLTDSLRQAILQLDIDTVAHLHSVFLPELYAVARELKKRPIPYVLSPHSGYDPQGMRKNATIKAVYMTFFEKRLIAGARALHAIGESEIGNLRQLGASQPIHLIPNGQDFSEVQFTPEETVKPMGRPLFGFCGRLAKEHKGLDLLITGFALYKKTGGQGELWLMGDGPDRAFLHSLAAKEGVYDSVKFLGPMFGDRKLSHLSQMDIFAHTSRWEGMPMAVLEAAALGKPLLISRATNMADYVIRHGNGMVLSENTALTIEKAMFDFDALFYSVGLISLGERSRKLIETELNWPRITELMISKLYPGTGNEPFN